jgi:hypothetical protein
VEYEYFKIKKNRNNVNLRVLSSFPNIVTVRAGFVVVGGAGAVKLWRPLSVTENDVMAILFFSYVLITKNTNLLSLFLEKEISQQNLWILLLLRGGSCGERLGCPPPLTPVMVIVTIQGRIGKLV